ncbi:cytosine-specific DNA methyltransferase [Weissella oryzae SG25]|uniref:Cytosine-specific methyltransferase n=1 Tax=Weissella oryzae (strain DSM 25784 / JCM 18191 / LMG 30913 / SG25) TaxID=1329250 RepID=A0A069CTI3_WEIOS|nr:DNA cytosine methyltransferase [Weissella oryzae]GAK30717.1 cytosine-specific DNA methyltransferase [Weissella oryzae SG25]
MKFLDLFSGIGGFRLGLTRAGFEPAGYVELDKFARQSYEAMYDTQGEWTATDITKVTDEEWREFNGTVELIAGGFPCQSFSIAGKRKGFLDETKGTLFFEIARAAKEIKPQLLLLENVKGLLNHDQGRTFRTILATLDELGYDTEWSVLNSKDFGVPQNRERVYIIGHLRGSSGREILPLLRENNKVNVASISDLTSVNDPRHGRRGNVLGIDGIAPTLTATDYKTPNRIAIPVMNPDRLNMKQGGRRFKTNGEPSFTLTTMARHGVLLKKPRIIQLGRGFNKGGVHNIAPTLSASSYQENNFVAEAEYRIRKLTPRECWRLQAFPDDLFDKAKASGMSDTQLYKQAGNSVTVNVIEYIGSLIYEATIGVNDES